MPERLGKKEYGNMKMKKTIKMLAAFILMVLTAGFMLSGRAAAETYGDFTYEVLGNGTISITGYYGSETIVTIPQTIEGKDVTDLGSQAFSTYADGKNGCRNVEEFILPSTLKTVASNAFHGCVGLKRIVIPEGVERLEGQLFYSCSGLEYIEFPSTLTYIAMEETYSAFAFCYNIREIKVSESNKDYCSVDGVFFSKDMTVLYKYPQLKEGEKYVVPSSVKKIVKSAFVESKNLKEVVIPDSVTEVGNGAFSYSEKLEKVTLSNNLTEISEICFANCTVLKEITLPSKITAIGYNAFKGCPSITGFVIPDSVQTLSPGSLDFGRETVLTVGSVASLQPVITTSWCLDYISGDETVATVSDKGKVTGKKSGKTSITVMLGGKRLGTMYVNVEYTDVTSAKKKYYYDSVYWAVENDITHGYIDNDGLSRTFGPEKSCTREQVVTFLWRANGKPRPNSMKSPFKDVKKNADGTYPYYYKAILWAAEQGIAKGYSSGKYKGKFGVGKTITREECVVFLYRAAGSPDVEGIIDKAKAYLGFDPYERNGHFPDVAGGKYYYNAVRWAFIQGITKGYDSGEYAGKFGVGVECLREHVITFLYRGKWIFSSEK